MPYVIRRPPKRVLALAGACASLLVVAAPAVAAPGQPGTQSAPALANANGGPGGPPSLAAAPAAPAANSCPAGPSSQVFAQFGDPANYSLVQGGSFEGPLAGWTLQGASVVSGNEPFYVNNSNDSRSLNISPGGQATSPTFCLTSAFPAWRFFANSAGNAPGSALNVWVQWTDQNGTSGQVPVTALGGTIYGSWAPSPSLTLGALLANGNTVNAQLVFSATSGDSWQIDDVYLDPYAK